jgi:hypothetical protein
MAQFWPLEAFLTSLEEVEGIEVTTTGRNAPARSLLH